MAHQKLTQQEFQEQFEDLLVHELPEVRKNPERSASLIEMLAHALSMAISVSAQGDGRVASTLIDGTEKYIVDEVTRLTPALAKIYKEGKL